MVANVGCYVAVSVCTRQGAAEQAQAARFVDLFRAAPRGSTSTSGAARRRFPTWGAARPVPRRHRAGAALADYARRRGHASPEAVPADAALVQFAETELAGAMAAPRRGSWSRRP